MHVRKNRLKIKSAPHLRRKADACAEKPTENKKRRRKNDRRPERPRTPPRQTKHHFRDENRAHRLPVPPICAGRRRAHPATPGKYKTQKKKAAFTAKNGHIRQVRLTLCRPHAGRGQAALCKARKTHHGTVAARKNGVHDTPCTPFCVTYSKTKERYNRE